MQIDKNAKEQFVRYRKINVQKEEQTETYM